MEETEYRVQRGRHRGAVVWEVHKGASSGSLVVDAYRTRESAERLADLLRELAPDKARD